MLPASSTHPLRVLVVLRVFLLDAVHPGLLHAHGRRHHAIALVAIPALRRHTPPPTTDGPDPRQLRLMYGITAWRMPDYLAGLSGVSAHANLECTVGGAATGRPLTGC